MPGRRCAFFVVGASLTATAIIVVAAVLVVVVSRARVSFNYIVISFPVLFRSLLVVDRGSSPNPLLLKKRVQCDRVRKQASTKITCAPHARFSKINRCRTVSLANFVRP